MSSKKKNKPLLMHYNNNEIIGGNNIANEFANYFQSAYNIAESSKYFDEITHNYPKMPNDYIRNS